MTVARIAGCLLVLAASGLLPAASGGEAATHEAVVQQMIKAFEAMSTTLATVQDEETARAARPELKKGTDVFLAARVQAEKLPPPDKAEKDRLTKTWRPKLEAAMSQFFKEVRRVERVPGGREVLLEIQPVLRHNDKRPK